MSDITIEFQELLNRDDVTEQNCQDFLEKNTELFYTPFLLNHQVHLSSIISKFPLDTSLVTDFVYLTKSSDFWYVVLVELEHPNKALFRNDKNKIVSTSEMTEAMSQIYSWQEFIAKNKNEVLRRLNPLLIPIQLRANPIFFKYLLVIGRSEQKSVNQGMRDRLANLCNDDIHICTYDSLISYYKHSPRLKKNVLKLSKNYFEIKYLHQEEPLLFDCLLPEILKITPEQKSLLISRGYDIEDWEKGKLLSYNGKMTSEKWKTSRKKQKN
ncbi:Shedu immune nuclease family protein [Anabaena sp. CCY 9402-a]|uniref:Shedu immune nuclease family protein n=1 Tax=Anabaena sp. CCY 9402-a TaxID=3103867 RepID=UPI0039C731BF